MTEDQVAAVQRSFAEVAPVADAAAKLFYARLFEIAPQVRPLFRGDMENQGRKLMATLSVVVHGLRDLDAIVPVAQTLAVRHIAYGVRADHYEAVGNALLWTLREGLGDTFDAETHAAWAAAYTLLSGVMIDAAYGDPAARGIAAE